MAFGQVRLRPDTTDDHGRPESPHCLGCSTRSAVCFAFFKCFLWVQGPLASFPISFGPEFDLGFKPIIPIMSGFPTTAFVNLIGSIANAIAGYRC